MDCCGALIKAHAHDHGPKDNNCLRQPPCESHRQHPLGISSSSLEVDTNLLKCLSYQCNQGWASVSFNT